MFLSRILSSQHFIRLMPEFQSEIDRVMRETSEATSRRDALAKSIKDKEQVQIVLGKTQISKTKYCVAGANALLPQVLEGTNAAVHEAAAKLEEKRAEEASGRAALAETYARIVSWCIFEPQSSAHPSIYPST